MNFEIIDKGRRLKDEEGEWIILCSIELEKENITLYCNGRLIWIHDKKTNKKYLYYTD